MLRNVNFGMPRSSTCSATIAAARAEGPNSNSLRRWKFCVDTAIPGIPSSAPSSAPDTVPEYVTSSPRFQPLLIPETMRSGFCLMRCEIARFTQSVGVPSIPYVFGPIVSMRSGRRNVSAWPMALASCIGATIVTLPRCPSAAASVLIPSECTPSSLVTRISRIGIFDCIGGNEEQQHSRHARKRGAGHERNGRAELLVQLTEENARNERADADRRVVPAERRAAAVSRRQIRDECLLRAFGQRE